MRAFRGMIAIVIGLICLLGLSNPAGAVSLGFTDTNLLGATSPITYTLTFSTDGGPTSATFTITTPIDPGGSEWFATAFDFKFDTSSAASLSNLVAPALTGPWSIANSTTQVLQAGGNYTTLLQDRFSGFYATSLAPGGLLDDITDGICLTCGPGTFSFTFDFTLTGGTLNTISMPFQVRYHDGLLGSGNQQFNQLSAALVPEPAPLVLMGSGLVILGLLGRRRLFK